MLKNQEYLNMYGNYKSLLSSTASDIVAFKESWSDSFCREELNRVYNLLIKEFKNIDFLLFNEKELKQLDFKWFDDDLICMPTWVLDCLPEGTEVYSINGNKIIIDKETKLSKDTRFNVSAYGFNKSQLRDTKLNSLLDG